MRCSVAISNALSVIYNMQSPNTSEHLHNILLSMVEPSVDERASLTLIDSVCSKFSSIEDAEEEVDKLVSYVFGTPLEVSHHLGAGQGTMFQHVMFCSSPHLITVKQTWMTLIWRLRYVCINFSHLL